MRITLLLLTGLVFAPLTALHAADVPKPNIVLILADDLGWGDLGVTGSKFYEAPRIDALAKQGVSIKEYGPTTRPKQEERNQ